MLYVRGDRADYDTWSALGNPGWSYQEVLPYFKKSQNQKDPQFGRNSAVHSTGGLYTVETPSFKTPLSIAFIKAVQWLGYNIKDINDGDSQGFNFVQVDM